MAQIVLGIGTSHTAMTKVPPELWDRYATLDRKRSDYVYPPDARVLDFDNGAKYVAQDMAGRSRELETFQNQSAAANQALDTLAETLKAAQPDVTVIISDDQDEWFYESNMPRFLLYWGNSLTLIPRTTVAASGQDADLAKYQAAAYGETRLDVPVASRFGRFVLDHLLEHDFDIAHSTYAEPSYGGEVARRYGPSDDEVASVKKTPEHEQGMPHGFAFVVHRLMNDQPSPILPIFQNTCYPPNMPTPRRSYQLGRAIADAIAAWPEDIKVAVIASGGLSHFVTDEESDRMVLDALQRGDSGALQALPRERMVSAGGESLNWVALGAVMEGTGLSMELLDYVPIYRSEAATGIGLAYARWQ
ncbi:catalytic LigB subunit of aromatic ring-opening dioxygenase [Rhodococcus wratislaviensis]|uniref:Aromatic ring-opening dioxygenase n=1 Tax=Rhodococcus wratislaviensis TaxID=44752 RepID=A0AB38FCW9_RHOWR|nr:hypothetical protein [Rhodococcus wratislaviensis]REE75485.1 catalytic LigB subunit of aromatic ring-opening dioxygenase [Rhodococcus wratislaviensis]SPZ39480.1 aromatic ring-opening dioxygenase [Rhodococcus wratislaviensis]